MSGLDLLLVPEKLVNEEQKEQTEKRRDVKNQGRRWSLSSLTWNPSSQFWCPHQPGFLAARLSRVPAPELSLRSSLRSGVASE